MLFNSFIFFIFLALVIPIYNLLSHKYKAIFLLGCSYLFYGYWDWRFLSLLFISTMVDFLVGKAIYNSVLIKRKKYLLFLSLFVNLGILGFFKYFNFFIDSFNASLNIFNFQLDYLHLNIILPVGISFYTFQTLTYTIDIYRGKLKPTSSLVNFALYVSFFPQLVAGPIERAKNLLPQISKLGNASAKYVQEGIVLISIGLFRKVLLGDTSGRIVDQIFANPEYYSSLELITGLILFSFQIYNDFAGYSSIARGTAKLLGVDLMENFNQPYLSRNITEFWRRWHISLSSWLKDYLYIPLGGNQKGKNRTYINLMLTMLLGGLWHGASWTFVFWGGLHGIYLAIHKFLRNGKKTEDRFSQKILSVDFVKYLFGVVSTYILVLFTWLFFRAESFSFVQEYLSNIFNWTQSAYSERFLTIIIAYSLSSFLLDVVQYKTKDHTFLLRLKPEFSYAIVIAILMGCFLYMFQAEPMPFIYFQF